MRKEYLRQAGQAADLARPMNHGSVEKKDPGNQPGAASDIRTDALASGFLIHHLVTLNIKDLI